MSKTVIQYTQQSSITVLCDSGMSITESTTLIQTYGTEDDVPLNKIDASEYKYSQGL